MGSSHVLDDTEASVAVKKKKQGEMDAQTLKVDAHWNHEGSDNDDHEPHLPDELGATPYGPPPSRSAEPSAANNEINHNNRDNRDHSRSVVVRKNRNKALTPRLTETRSNPNPKAGGQKSPYDVLPPTKEAGTVPRMRSAITHKDDSRTRRFQSDAYHGVRLDDRSDPIAGQKQRNTTTLPRVGSTFTKNNRNNTRSSGARPRKG
eukprot:UN25489